ncbi:hypothetical protein [Actinophytocola sp.]|uniref:hypothetical protein n=1 Tax=Actinophytocola sp. TaxID=1872138 RepID=UPI00389B18FE
MLEAIAVWSGAVVGIVVVLLMALGPVIVEVDSWWYERRMNRRARKAENMETKAPSPARPELARV